MRGACNRLQVLQLPTREAHRKKNHAPRLCKKGRRYTRENGYDTFAGFKMHDERPAFRVRGFEPI